MSVQNQHHTKGAKKGKQMYHFDLPLHEALVRTYIAPLQMERMTGKYGKRAKLELYPPASGPCCSQAHEDECEHSKSPKFWTLRATGKHRQTIRLLAQDMKDRHDNIVRILSDISIPKSASREKEEEN